jgi:hypothetical protein
LSIPVSSGSIDRPIADVPVVRRYRAALGPSGARASGIFALDQRRLAHAAAILYILKEVFGGVFRYLTVITGTEALNYVPPFLALLALYLYYANAISAGRVDTAMAAVGLFTLVYGIYACFDSISLKQSVIGFYIFLPVFLGMLLRVQKQGDAVFQWMLWLWAIAVVGIIVNSVVEFPWVGTSYEILGVQREVARKWSYLDYNRLAGFGRSSIATSYLIVFYCCAVLYSRRYPVFVRLGCYGVSTYALFLSTNKTALMLCAGIPIIMAGYEACKPLFPARLHLPYYWAKASIVCLLVVLIGLPLWSEIPNILHDRQTFYFFSFASLLERMQYAWPMSLALLSHGGNVILGRGIGGIGTAQKFTEPDLYMFADNLFVYVFVSVGVVGVVALFYSLVARLRTDYLVDPDAFEVTYLLLLYILGIGITVNTIEGPFQALVLGILAARAMTSRRPSERLPSMSATVVA